MAVSKCLRFEVLRRDNHACRYCGRTPPEVRLVVDHVMPEALGGRTEPANLVTACFDCNSGKSATPPDATVVEDVAQDALRWARARTAAAATMLADVEARQRQRAEFQSAWNGWKFEERGRRRIVPLPITWPATVDGFLAAGLPMPVLLDCLDRAMRTTKLQLDGVFRYMCGIAWKRVAEIQDAARAVVGPPPAVDDNWVADTLGGALDELSAEDRDRFTDGDPTQDLSMAVHTASAAICYLNSETELLVASIQRLLKQFPPGHVARCEENARYLLERSRGFDWSDSDLTAATLDDLTSLLGFIGVDWPDCPIDVEAT